MNEVNDRKPLDRLQKVAVGASVAVFIAFAGFWIFQINSAYELLKLAYGW